MRLNTLVIFAVLVFAVASPNVVQAQSSDVEMRQNLRYAVHDGVSLTGDLYLPKGPGPFPALVAIHGGAYLVGSAALYRLWGPYLAERGYIVFSINYRLVTDGQKKYPEAVHDVRAAVQFLRGRADAMKVDPDRIGLIGDSAGAYFSALVALAGDKPPFAGAYADDPFSRISTAVKVCVGINGVYDLAAQWNDDIVHRPIAPPSRLFLGADLFENRALYFAASPVSYVVRSTGQPVFLLAWGSEHGSRSERDRLGVAR